MLADATICSIMSDHRLRPSQSPDASNIEVVKAMIERLPREDRAMLRPWLLARFDVRGYPVTAYGEQEGNGRTEPDRRKGERRRRVHI